MIDHRDSADSIDPSDRMDSSEVSLACIEPMMTVRRLCGAL